MIESIHIEAKRQLDKEGALFPDTLIVYSKLVMAASRENNFKNPIFIDSPIYSPLPLFI